MGKLKDIKKVLDLSRELRGPRRQTGRRTLSEYRTMSGPTGVYGHMRRMKGRSKGA